jgi:shikimate kinase
VSGYYDYTPLVQLDTPVVLTGYLTEFTRAVAYRAAALLGLPYHDIERLIEHEAGQDIAKLVFDGGETSYRQLEALCLQRVLRERPSGLIALSDGGLLDDDNLDRIRHLGRLVLFDFDLPNLYWRAQRLSRRSDSTDWHPLFEGPPSSIDEIRPFFLERKAGFSRPDLCIDSNSLEPPAACEIVMRWMESGP